MVSKRQAGTGMGVGFSLEENKTTAKMRSRGSSEGRAKPGLETLFLVASILGCFFHSQRTDIPGRDGLLRRGLRVG